MVFFILSPILSPTLLTAVILLTSLVIPAAPGSNLVVWCLAADSSGKTGGPDHGTKGVEETDDAFPHLVECK